MPAKKADIALLNLCKARILEVSDAANLLDETPNLIPIFNIKIKSLAESYASFNKVLVDIISLSNEADEEIYDQIRLDVDAAYFNALAKFDSLNPALVQHKVEPNNHTSRVSPNLPPLSLKNFSGDPSAWQSYLALFETLVNANQNISNIEKFSYLLSSLSGEPLQVVKTIPLSHANYQIAFNTLCDRYNNPKFLATFHWRAITKFPPLKSENPHELRKLLDCFSENLAILTNLKFPTDQWNFILVDLLFEKIHSSTRKRFELQSDPKQIPCFKNLRDFLLQQCAALETFSSVSATSSFDNSIKASTSNNLFQKSFSHQSRPRVSSHMASVEKLNISGSQIVSPLRNCKVCHKNHSLYVCPTFLGKNPTERYQTAKDLGLCINCLGVHSQQCKSKVSCKTCGKRHHSLLHFITNASSDSFSVPSTSNSIANVDNSTPHNSIRMSDSSASATNALSSTTNLNSGVTVLLSTAVIEAQDRSGNFQPIRVLLDPGSQASFIRDDCVNKLMLSRTRSQVPIYGLGQTNAAANRGATYCTIRSQSDSEKSLEINTFIISSISSNLPNSKVSIDNCDYLNGLQLADKTWHIPGPIDMLLGADVYPFVINGGIIQGKFLQPAAINTIFGWTLIGPIKCLHSNSVQAFFASLESPIDQTIRKFWEIENLPIKPFVSPEEERADKIFESSFQRDNSGRFSVLLPFKGELPHFDGSFDVAERRLFSLERKLLTSTALHNQYKDFMQDYLDSGHMTLFQSSPIGNDHYFIPHHAIFKDDCGISKIRVVFDASAKAKNDLSLNDCLLAGPTLQNDIASILLRFRAHTYVFTCDVRQMFRQILLAEEHRNYQLILWRFSVQEPVQIYRLNTVTYGLKSSPYLAIRALQQLSIDGKDKFPLAAEAIRSNLYVDDLACGAESLESALLLRNELIQLFESGCFELRKWSSNHLSILEGLPDDFCKYHSIDFDQNEAITVLGLQWHPTEDTFSFKVKQITSICTKRGILSEVARIYDPLGFLGPLTLFTKRLIQHLWMLGLDWDDIPPEDISHQWQQFQKELPLLTKLSIPRCLPPPSAYICQMHGFCDASEAGYAAVVYFRFVNLTSEEIFTRFVISKNKVAPIKRLSIPRLELCAAGLLASLISFVNDSYKNSIAISEHFAWSDSTVALAWIRSPPYRWKTFVANRVSTIQGIIAPNRWFHVRSSDNPADSASRGLLPSAVLSCSFWWAGPSWLSDPCNLWPPQPILTTPSSEVISEKRMLSFITHIEPHIIDVFLSHFSSLRKIQGILAYIYRWLTPKDQRFSGPLSEIELYNSLMIIVKHVQLSYFSLEIRLLKTNSKLSKTFRKLSPFLDPQGILRVGGRLKHASLPYSEKYPALLPKTHRLSELVVRSIHEKHSHPGLNTTSYLIQQNFWIISIKKSIRSYLSSCHQCFRARPLSAPPPIMGDLPSMRVNQVKPFSCVGVDFAGPFSIKVSRLRQAKILKTYVCLFICFATKAVHIELVSDLSSDAFLAALRRFIARRGRCSQIFSDCGTNFVGASRQLSNLLQNAVDKEGIQWSFNPPSAPHFGGLWESGVKSVKTHLLRVVGDQTLTFEELYTVLVQIESLLNSRPLCPMSTDPNDLQSLTPGHFLTLEPLSAPPVEDLSCVKMPLSNRWRLLQKLHQDFWVRWSQEYLHTLYQRAKWNHSDNSHIAEDSLVLMKDD